MRRGIEPQWQSQLIGSLRRLRVFVDQSVQDGAPLDPGGGHRMPIVVMPCPACGCVPTGFAQMEVLRWSSGSQVKLSALAPLG
jgi:hypothetical protein